MADSKTYTQAINLIKLAKEVKESITDLETIQDHGDGTCTLKFTDDLTAQEEADLDAIVAAHVNTAPSPPLIESLSNQQAVDFREIDYTILPIHLHAERTFDKGELQAVTWYTDNTLTTPVLKVDIVYFRDTFDFPTHRVTTRTWYNEDGSLNPNTSVRTKYYDTVSQQGEVKKRRENNILNMQAQTLSYMVITEGGDPLAVLALGKAYMDTVDTEINKYIKSGSTALSDAIVNNITEAWMDNIVPGDVITIRDYMLAELS